MFYPPLRGGGWDVAAECLVVGAVEAICRRTGDFPAPRPQAERKTCFYQTKSLLTRTTAQMAEVLISIGLVAAQPAAVAQAA